MRKSFVKTVATLGIGMMIGSATLAAAAPSTIQAVISNFKVVVNNENANLKNAPIVSSGVTYLPVREVADLLDADVKYDAKNKQININSKGDGSLTTQQTSTSTSYRVGDNANVDGANVTISKVENTLSEAGEQVLNIHFSVKNTTDKELRTPGMLRFKTEDKSLESKLNSGGYVIKFDKYKFIAPGESATGYYSYIVRQDVNIDSIDYYLEVTNSQTNSTPVTWEVN